MRPFSIMRSVVAAAALSIVVLPLSGCKFGEKTIGLGQEQVAVHGVLDPQQFSLTVLVEKLLTGVPTTDTTFDPADPVHSGGGVPISGARVVITAASGDSVVLTEDLATRGDGKGAGLYRFRNGDPLAPDDSNSLAILPGTSYLLRVTTPNGTVVTGSTVVPNGAAALIDHVGQAFNRDQDSVFLAWGEVPLAYRYAFRVGSPRGPMMLFLDSLEYLVSGELRNVFTEGFPRTFVPGFLQTVTVGAVDRNFYDYFRSRNDVFTGRGLINHLQGGVGVFGSYVLVRGHTLQVRADQDELIESAYQRTSGTSSIVPATLNLFVESRSGTLRQISGQWFDNAGVVSRGLLGTIDEKDQMTLALLPGQTTDDTVAVLDLEFNGTGLSGTVRGTTIPAEFRLGF